MYFVEEGEYVDGKSGGRWVVRYKTGERTGANCGRGQEHGEWVRRRSDGGIDSGSYYNHGEHTRIEFPN